MWYVNAPPHFSKNSNAIPKMKTMEEEGIGVHSITRNIVRIKGRVGTLGWGLRRVISGSIVHTNLHKPNNKLVSVWLEHFWCKNEPRAYTDSQDSSQLEFGTSHHLPPL
jgi:hypothetical protein